MADTAQPMGLSPWWRALGVGTVWVLGLGSAQAGTDFPYATPVAGQQRWVIELPPQTDESLWEVEVVPGRTLEVDCNRVILPGQWQTQDVQGWGYPFHTFVAKGHAASTKMACLQDKKRQEWVAAPSLRVRYNSRLPVVVYAPQDHTVQYRFWQAKPALQPAVVR